MTRTRAYAIAIPIGLMAGAWYWQITGWLW